MLHAHAASFSLNGFLLLIFYSCWSHWRRFLHAL